MSKILLKCVKEKNKLRIKFFSFTDDEGKIYTNVYNNELNCKFPKDIRKEGYYYEIKPEYLSIVNSNGKPFYIIKNKDIKIIENFDISFLKIFEINECVICLDSESTQVLIPCGHKCLCNNCSSNLLENSKCCPLCRTQITTII
jgi:hypothetical protein